MPSKRLPAKATYNVLLPDNEPGEELEGARLLPISLIDVNPDQPRQSFDSRKLDQLTISIKKHGVKTPITVRPVDDRFIVVAGERRRRAASAAGLTHIPAIIESTIDGAASTVLSLVENIQRSNVAPAETAIAIEKLQRETGWSNRRLAKEVGLTHTWINLNIKLVREHPDLLERMLAGELTANQAKQLMSGETVESGNLVSTPASQPIDPLSREEVDRAYPVQVAGYTRGGVLPWRQRPLDSFNRWIERTDYMSVPNEERSDVLAKALQARERLDRMIDALGGARTNE